MVEVTKIGKKRAKQKKQSCSFENFISKETLSGTILYVPDDANSIEIKEYCKKLNCNILEIKFYNSLILKWIKELVGDENEKKERTKNNLFSLQK